MVTADSAPTFERLYARNVAWYDSTPAKRRADDDVRRPVRDKLMERGINVPFEPKAVVCKGY